MVLELTDRTNDENRPEPPTDTGLFEVFREELTRPSAPSRTACLVMLVGGQAGRTYPIGLTGVVIGRASDADIQIFGNDVSRRHARISWNDDGAVIEDLESKNGTSVNGLPVRRHRLRIGDHVQIATSAIMVFAQPGELERRVQQLQKLDALSTFAATMAHDLRNLLGVVSANAEMLIMDVTTRTLEQVDVLSSARDISEAARRAMDLMRRLIEFARRDAGDEPPVPVPLAPIASNVIDLVRGNAAARIEFAVDVPASAIAQATPSSVHQILLNLALNAIDAMPTGGRLTIVGGVIELDRAPALELHLPGEGTYVDLRVADTGIGMDRATLERVFEPFFTTKPAGKGTGLGLASVFGLVRSHGGSVLAESTPGAGSVFRVLLPAEPFQRR